ncbi:MAG: hypothetical protein EOP50_08260 [Sphingobacteriales bacterium]|nr:MAG: hypothetical protein EOP50_08260 [Sphingobacteriales bacterium]
MNNYVLGYLIRWYVTTHRKYLLPEAELWEYLEGVAPQATCLDMIAALQELEKEGYISRFVIDPERAVLFIEVNRENIAA